MEEQNNLELARVSVEEVFHGMVIFPLQVGDSFFEAFSIHKLPVKYMLEFAESDGPNRVPILMKYLQLCLINPADYEKVLELNGEEILELIDQWMGRSEQAKEFERNRKQANGDSEDFEGEE